MARQSYIFVEGFGNDLKMKFTNKTVPKRILPNNVVLIGRS